MVLACTVCTRYPARYGHGEIDHVPIVMIVKNFGLSIPDAVEKQSRHMVKTPKQRTDNFAKQAKKDFAEYAKVKR